MLITIATVLAALLDLGVVLLGANGLWRPQAAAGFGIPASPVSDPTFRAWLRVKAVRDLMLGATLFVILIGAAPTLLGWFLLALAAAPVGDALIVARAGGPKVAVYGIHLATAAAFAVVSALLLAA
jgi:hypothetical protein